MISKEDTNPEYIYERINAFFDPVDPFDKKSQCYLSIMSHTLLPMSFTWTKWRITKRQVRRYCLENVLYNHEREQASNFLMNKHHNIDNYKNMQDPCLGLDSLVLQFIVEMLGNEWNLQKQVILTVISNMKSFTLHNKTASA